MLSTTMLANFGLILLVEDAPKGFPRVARFLNSDESFMIHRRFGCLFSRLLLTRQDEISRMEEQLEAMDRRDQREGNGKYIQSIVLDERRGNIPPTWACSRIELLEKLELKVKQYGPHTT